jgi:hypothetical protein
MRIVLTTFLFFFLASFSSCYSFKGISIPQGADTYYVEDFSISASARNSPSDINQKFAEALRLKVRNESKLQYAEVDPHITFSGQVTNYTVNSVAPEEGNTTALNRLEIRVKVNYVNSLNEEDEWSNNFSFFQDYDSAQDLQNIQDDLIDAIFIQLTEDVFNKAFTNW